MIKIEQIWWKFCYENSFKHQAEVLASIRDGSVNVLILLHGLLRCDRPRTHKICDIKNFLDKIWWFLWKFGDFVKIWNLVKFEILNPKISKFEILNPNTKISNLDTNFLNFDDFCYKFEENFAEIDKIGDISKFEILNPKIQNLKSFETLKSKIFNFDKIWPKIKIPPRWFIITLRFHQNSKVKIFQNWSEYWRTILHKLFSKFWSRYQNPKITKIGSNHQNFEENS